MNVILGENSSYYTHYHQGRVFRKCFYHGSLQATYPELYKFISEHSNTSCPTGISLGPQGSYFINVAGRKSMHCHPDAIHLEEKPPRDIRRLWWGVGGSYVLEQEDGRILCELRGYYGSLESTLSEPETSHYKVKELALDIQNPYAFALLTTEGSVISEGTANVVHSHLREFATQHFGSRMVDGGSCDVDGESPSKIVFELP
ncbi:hypothetical protein LX36DRAFT_390515 [Colletotrichum falcatum]|nr:hypothetical protein LX36DRAFT_390515 [Colletotrichum falcatum]